MRKKLVWSGNSVALIVDRTVLRLMGMKAGTYVDISTDGQTLMVQRSAEQYDEDAEAPQTIAAAIKSKTPSAIEVRRVAMRAPGVFQELVQRWTIPFEVFSALYHGPTEAPDPSRGPIGWLMSLSPYRGWVDTADRFDPSAAELATMLRFEVLRDERAGDAAWDEAVRTALEAVPMVREL